MASPPSRPAADTVLVTGGAGYIGAILTERLLERGYRVRVLDRLYWGEKPLERVRRPHRARRGRRPRHPAERPRRRRRRDPPRRPLERPDRRVRPRGQLADERRRHRGARQGLRRARRRARGLRLLVLALRRAAARACTTRRAPIVPRGAYATSKRYGEEALLELQDEGLCPVILRNGTVYGHSPRMRFDLVVNTFVKDALLKGGSRCTAAAGCGARSWTCATSSDAMIAAYEAPERARAAARSSTSSTRTTRSASWRCWWPARCSCSGATVTPRGGARADAHPRLRVLEREALAAGSASSRGARWSRRSPTCWRDRRRGPRDAHRPALLQHPLARAAQRGAARASSSSARSCERSAAS